MRPEGFKNPFDEEVARIEGMCRERGIDPTWHGEPGIAQTAFEAGADAYEEGLRKKGVYHESMWPFNAPRQKTNGHWVFIPEEKE